MSVSYIGIDVNLSGYGLAIVNRREITLSFLQFIRRDKLDEQVTFWANVTNELHDKIIVKGALDWLTIAIEDPTGMEQKAWMTAAVLNKLIGMLTMKLLGNGRTLIYPSAVIWKKAVLGHAGSAKNKVTKEDVMKVTSKRLLGVEDVDYFEGNHHISDAVALAMCAEQWDKGEIDAKSRDGK